MSDKIYIVKVIFGSNNNDYWYWDDRFKTHNLHFCSTKEEAENIEEHLNKTFHKSTLNKTFCKSKFIDWFFKDEFPKLNPDNMWFEFYIVDCQKDLYKLFEPTKKPLRKK